MLRLYLVFARTLLAAWIALGQLPRQAASALGAADGDQPARPARFTLVLLVVLPSALFAALVMPRIHLVMTPSIDAYAVRVSPGPIRRGDYVMFTLRHPVAGPNAVQVTKHALCLPGDRLTLSERPSAHAPSATGVHYYCNGRLLGVSLPEARGGLKLEHMNWSGVIPPGLAYVGSPHPRGFDSRYLGLLPIARLTRMERIL
ncbi:S26 family signal peptidase [Novosphingobium kaempferiae]|uniref:S26 family signal peptidase n=1 Tax=Novosphingobium kaempferiae TaxID=2896849 RepID=UPI001E3AD369|nr:S26 family signal peptidase [Novosphingobium kaempferiae]